SESETTTILPATAPVLYVSSTSQRSGTVSCGGTVKSSDFQSGETTIRFQSGLGCASQPVGLTMQASGKIIDLAGFKIVGAALPANLGNAGIAVAATNVTINGGSTNGTAGIEYFDFAVKDDGGNDGLTVNSLRIFRARSAAIQTVSNGITISQSEIDKTVAVTNATATLPGGVGIHATGETTISDTIVRRSGAIGIWADGSSTTGNVTTIIGNGPPSTSSMQVTDSAGIGIQLDNGPHSVKVVLVAGDGIAGTSTDGVVIGPTGNGITLDSLDVRNHGGDGVVVDGVNSLITTVSVQDTVGGDGFV